MKNCKNLTTSEVQMIMNGATMFVEPMKQNKYSYFGVPFCEEYPDLEAGLYTSTVVDKWGEEDAGPEIWGAISGKGEHCWESPYQPSQIIYVREPWMQSYNRHKKETKPVTISNHPIEWGEVSGWRSPASMPKEAARIFLRIGSVQVVRVKSVNDDQAQSMGIDRDIAHTHNVACGESKWDIPFSLVFREYYIARFSQESWDNNDWIWLFTFTRVNSVNG